jgi:PAP2 superfamily protein
MWSSFAKGTKERMKRTHNGRSFPRVKTLFILTVALLAATSMLGAAPVAAADPVRTWNQLALQTVRETSASDAQAARLYAMVNVAMYDAVNGILSSHGNDDDRDFAVVPPGDAPPQGDTFAAASAAAHAVLAGEFPARAAIYNAQLQQDLDALTPSSRTTAGQEWGASVGAQVRAARANDGSSPNETQPAGSGPGVFRAAWSGAQFRNLTPFAIADPSIYVTNGPPALNTLSYAAAFAEVKLLGNAAIPDAAKLDTFRFWNLPNGSTQPPGAWIQIGLAVTATHSLQLPQATRLFALLSMALSDTVGPTYMTKFVYRHWRPATAIREASTDGNPNTDEDATWSPRAGGIGGTPEHTSGHSSFSGAGAAVLAGFFCADHIAFSLATDTAPGGLARTYPSFSSAANEAGLSRVLGGIHFSFSNLDGLAVGRAIGAEVLAKKLLLKQGPTHFGECPR